MSKKSETSKEEIIKKTTEELFGLLGIEGNLEVLLKEGLPAGRQEEVEIVLETTETGIVIGYHGETLESLQLVLSLCISKRLGSFTRVILEIGDYRKNRTDWLKTAALAAKEKAINEQKEVAIPNLKSWERRIVHMLLQEDKEVISESMGDGKERTLVIKPR